MARNLRFAEILAIRDQFGLLGQNGKMPIQELNRVLMLGTQRRQLTPDERMEMQKIGQLLLDVLPEAIDAARQQTEERIAQTKQFLAELR